MKLFARTTDETDRNVRRLSKAQLISSTGDLAALIALIAIVYERTGGSGAWLTAAIVGSFVVNLVAGPLVGALGDRFDRRLVMVASDLAAGAAFVGLATVRSPLALVALALVAAAAESPFGPAAGAQLAMMVPQDRRARANASLAAAAGAGSVFGALIGGALVATVGAPMTFVINAASFVVSAALVLRVTGGPYRAESSTEHAYRGLWAGVRIVSRESPLRLTVASVGLGFLGGGMINLAEFPLIVHLGGGSLAWGTASAGWGVGRVIGARLSRRARGVLLERRLIVAGQVVVGVGTIACGLVPSVPAVVALFVLLGAGSTAKMTAANLVMQRWAPDPVRARCFAVLGSVGAASLGIAIAVAGVLLKPLGPDLVFVVGGSIALLGVLPSLRLPPHRQPFGPAPEAAGSSSTTRRRDTLLVPLPA
ncbi:MAG TPA: MFS transporter [Gaiellaceae bacterium]|jgi:MFS family permease|nr:MFS transporter [Gaiellaceae bacterium]